MSWKDEFGMTNDGVYLRFTIYGLRFTVYDLRFTIYDLRFTVYELRFTIYDWWFLVVNCLPDCPNGFILRQLFIGQTGKLI